MVEIYLTFMGSNGNKTSREKFCLKSFGAQYPFFFSNMQMCGFTDVDY